MNADHLNPATPAEWSAIADELSGRGWHQQPDFLAPPLAAALHGVCEEAWQAGRLHPAAIGRGAARKVDSSVRGDAIAWLDQLPADPALTQLRDQMEQLRCFINQTLMLGLFEYEAMVARYPPGARYQRHLDRFQGTEARTLTTVIYLNPGWQIAQGGQLRLYPDAAPPVEIWPQQGTLATFITAGTWHEVLPASRPRYSLTGWYRRRTTPVDHLCST